MPNQRDEGKSPASLDHDELPSARSQIDLEIATRDVLGLSLDEDWSLDQHSLADAIYGIADAGLVAKSPSAHSFLLALADALAADCKVQVHFEPLPYRWRFKLSRTPKGKVTFSEAVSSDIRKVRVLEMYGSEVTSGKLAKQAISSIAEKLRLSPKSVERLLKQAREDRKERTKLVDEFRDHANFAVKSEKPSE